LSIELLLGKSSLFRGLSEEELRQMAAVCVEDVYDAGESICREGEASTELYVRVEGEALVESEAGKGEGEHVLTTVEDDSILGELAFVDSGPRSASVRATGPCTVLTISRDDFEALAQSNPRLGYRVTRNIACTLAERLRNADQALLGKIQSQGWERG